MVGFHQLILIVFQMVLMGLNLISVSDLIKFKKDKFIKKFNCKSYDNVKDFLNDNELDTVMILSESGNHYDHAKQALNNGKHVITEKPACLIPTK